MLFKNHVKSFFHLAEFFQRAATGFTLVAFLSMHYSSYHHQLNLFTVGSAGLASVIAVLIDLALFGLVKGKMQTLGPAVGVATNVGPGSSTHFPLVPSGINLVSPSRLFNRFLDDSCPHLCSRCYVLVAFQVGAL